MGEADRGGSGGREDSGRGESGADGLHLLSKVGVKVSGCEGGRGWRGGGRDEERREHGKNLPRVGGIGVDLGAVEGRFGC